MGDLSRLLALCAPASDTGRRSQEMLSSSKLVAQVCALSSASLHHD